MVRVGKWAAAVAVAGVAAWAGVALTAQEPKPKPGAKSDAPPAPGAKQVDLSGLKEAVATAAKRGENVDDIRAALAALEKALPTARAGAVPPELQALRDAVDAANRKGENVEAIAKELLAVETAVAGRSLAKPKPQPRPEPPEPNPGFPRPNPGLPFPNVPFPALPNPGVGGVGGVDIELFNKSMELRRKAAELLIQNPRDPDVIKERQKLLAEANELMMKAMNNLAGGGAGGIAPIMPAFPALPDLGGRVADRARLGVRIERLPAVAVEQLGLEPNTGISVSMVTPNSAAEKAGLKVHDIILEFAGKPVSANTEEFIRRVGEVKAGEKVDLVVLRKGKKVDVKGVELPEAAKRPGADLPFPALPLPGGLLPDQPNARPLLPAVDVPGLRLAPAPPALPALPNPVAIPPGFASVSYTNNSDGFTLKAAKDGAKYVLTGTFDAAGRPTFGKLVFDQGGKSQTVEAADKLPADLKADVEALLKTVEPRK